MQAIFEEVNEKYIIEYGKLRTDYTVLGQEYGVSEGMEVIELDPAEFQRWVELADPIYDAWIEQANGRGLPGQEIVDMVRAADAKASAEYGSYGK